MLGTATIDQYDAEEDDDAHANFQDRYQYAATYFIQTVDPYFLVILATQRAPDRIWTTLEDKFGRENTTSFFDQLNSVFDTKYDASEPISDHINKYGTQWNRLQFRCSTATSSDRYALPLAFKLLFESTEAKAALLLRSLPESMNNIVDNLQTKEDLTYDHVHQRLLDLKSPCAASSADNKAYKSADVKGNGKAPGRKSPPKGNSGSKECTWCMKHYGGVGAKGHTWNECHKLKAKNENEKKKKEGSASNTAKIGTEETPEPVSTSSSL